MATDIAFAVGVVALLGDRVPPSLKLFLLTLAIVDDIGAIIVIGVFYSSGLNGAYLVAAVAVVVGIVLLNRAGIVWLAPYLALGAVLWLLTYESGVHATIAGVVLGLLTPARPLVAASIAREWAADLDDDPSAPDMDTMTRLARHAVSPAERLAHALHPWSSFLIVPVFALANAGVTVRSSAFDAPGAKAVALGVVVGLVLGKPVGIVAGAWLGARAGVARLPDGSSWPMMAGVGGVAGIGFTVSLFIAELAFGGGPLAEATLEGWRGWGGAVAEQGFVFLSEGARALREQGRGGTLIQVTGGSARRAMPGRGLWSAGAQAVRALVHAAAQELREEGIHVALLVVDATIESPKTAARTRDAPRDSLADQDEIARAVAYLAGQTRRAWTHELTLTPSGDRWVP
jgi:Na+/H+ antiporter NhaA